MITYLDVVNEVLNELNEVVLTSSNFSAATNIQKAVKDLTNRAYFDLCTEEYKWPFLSAGVSSGAEHGNTYIETVAGTRWYLLNPNRTDKDDDYAFVEWDRFYLTTEGVTGAVTPYKNNRLRFVDLDYWMRYFRPAEEDDRTTDSPLYGRPVRIIRNQDNIRFGLSPIPDDVYRVYFYAYTQPQKLVNYDDTFVFPDKYVAVLIARIRFLAWQLKENYQQASLAADDYKRGLRRMREQLLEDQPDFFSDDRVRFWY